MHYAWAGREAAVLWRTLCPQVWCFLCVSVPICIQPRCKTHSLPGPLLLQESDGASDNKQHRLRLQTGCWGLRLSGGADGSHCCREAVWVVSAVKHLAALIFLLTHKTATVTALELLSVQGSKSCAVVERHFCPLVERATMRHTAEARWPRLELRAFPVCSSLSSKGGKCPNVALNNFYIVCKQKKASRDPCWDREGGLERQRSFSRALNTEKQHFVLLSPAGMLIDQIKAELPIGLFTSKSNHSSHISINCSSPSQRSLHLSSLLFIWCISCSLISASIIISPESADPTDIDQRLAPAALV